MTRTMLPAAMAALLLCTSAVRAQEDENEDPKGLTAAAVAGLKLRCLGPALTSGRIGDVAVDPTDHSRWFVGVASGGVWRTRNAGTTFEPVFDGEGSYSIGCVAIDPRRPHVVWVGTGENNSQRSVSYGDGVYRSADGGGSWKRVGLEDSEHLGAIVIHPRLTDVVYVAAQGPLWSAGGDRGVYKTMDGGKSWKRVLEISEHTGASDLVMDPRDPDVLYASAYQRRRHVWTLVNGGPESAVYKTTDGGLTWKKLGKGLPGGEVGRIGLAVAPSRPDTVYAIVEASAGKGGFYRSLDAGASWSRRSDYVSRSPQYYQEIVVDPEDPDRVYSNDVYMQVTEDGGKTWHGLDEGAKHVDNHALWIDPEDPRHLLAGCDGGLYESFDRGGSWDFKANLPVTQFYRVAVDQDAPFYNVYGGTQDNFTLGGPSRTTSASGITNRDWFVTLGGDGFEAVVDPEDPDTVYSQYQYGGLARYDRRTGETVDIRPQVGPDHEPLRWNWNSPVIISPHSHTRLYFAANHVFRSDDRGDSWMEVSPDLTREIDRNALEVMGRTWSVDSPSYNRSTSVYGNVVSLCESPVEEGRLYAGTDDGLVQVTADGGRTWTAIESFPGVPEWTYVSDLEASLHDAETVYAAFDDHKRGNFRPYLLKSTDGGRTWTSVAGDLPERGSVHTVVEDHVDPELLFCGTEFGVFFTTDGGGRWTRLRGGMPTIAVRDLELQRRENDLVAGTFGRGIYVLDDYTALRGLDAETLEREAVLFPVRRALQYVERRPLGRSGKAFQGDAFYTAANPPLGAVFTYHLGEGLKTRRARRRAEERKAVEEGGDVAYPSWEELRAEDREQDPQVVLVVEDAAERVVRRITGPSSKGFHRVSWDLRGPSPAPSGSGRRPDGALVPPGTYSVRLATLVDGRLEDVAGPVAFEVVPLSNASLASEERRAMHAFQRRAAELVRAVSGAVRLARDTRERIEGVREALLRAPAVDPALIGEARRLELRLADLMVELTGDDTKSSRHAPTNPSIRSRAGRVARGAVGVTTPATTTQRESFDVASRAFERVLSDLRALVEDDLPALEEKLEAADAPWTPARIPRWRHR